MNVAMWEHSTSDNQILNVVKFTTLTPLSFLISCKLSFPIVGLKMSSMIIFALYLPTKFSYGI
jgi:hypothetical protein